MSMRSIYLHLSWGLAFLILAVACEPVAAPPAISAQPTATRVAEVTPTETPALVAFPTLEPSPIATATPSTPTPGPRISPALPVAQLVSPVANSQISVNQTFQVVIYAAADSGVARVELTDDNASVRVEAAPTPAPPIFSAIIPWTPTQIGPHVLRAVAYDANHRASAADAVTVTVIQDARKPTSIIVYPIGTPQVDLGGVLQIYGVATDEVGVTQVDLYVDNQIYTYVVAPTPAGQPALPFVFFWNALAPGTHTFFARAHDNQDQTNDSTPLKILVVDTQAPSLSVAFDRTNAPAGEPITLTVTALDVSGIQRIELLSGKEIFGTLTSPSPARQTALTAQVVFQNPNPGDYTIVARTYSANGSVKESPAQIVSLLRPGQSTPTPIPTITPTRTRARPPTTPRSQPPAPPKVEIISPADRFASPAPLRVTFSGQGNAELDRIELWGFAPGQPNPQIVCAIDAHATTQKSGQCEWSPPAAGVVTLFAQAVDIYRQSSRSAQITGYIGIPNLPTPMPTPPTYAGRWTALTASGPMTATLRQTGTTVRGEFRISGVETTGRITASTLRGDRLTFSVDFGGGTATPAPTAITETPTPSAAALSLDFDCLTDLEVGTLSCTFRDSRGRTGAAFFRRETTP